MASNLEEWMITRCWITATFITLLLFRKQFRVLMIPIPITQVSPDTLGFPPPAFIRIDFHKHHDPCILWPYLAPERRRWRRSNSDSSSFEFSIARQLFLARARLWLLLSSQFEFRYRSKHTWCTQVGFLERPIYLPHNKSCWWEIDEDRNYCYDRFGRERHQDGRIRLLGLHWIPAQ